MTLQNFTLGTFAQQGVAAGDFDSIATTTVGSGGTATVTFSSIPSTYTHLQVRILGRFEEPTNPVESIRTRFNSDSGNNYARHRLTGDGSTTSSAAATSTNFVNSGDLATNNASANIFSSTIVDILDYANTNKYKTIRVLDGSDKNGSGTINLRSGLWLSTSAITTIEFAAVAGSDFAEYSHFALYGIKA